MMSFERFQFIDFNQLMCTITMEPNEFEIATETETIMSVQRLLDLLAKNVVSNKKSIKNKMANREPSEFATKSPTQCE